MVGFAVSPSVQSGGGILKSTTTYIAQSPLPYGLGDLAPVMSQHQLDLHYNKHHKAYVTNYNSLLDRADTARAAGDFDTYIQLYN